MENVVVPLVPDTAWVVSALRVIARHANACATELESLTEQQEADTDATL
jgi:hypothetical protein